MTKTAIDFSKGRRGSVVKQSGAKQRITIRIDQDLLDWFRQKVGAEGGSYQTLMNRALREYVLRADGELAASRPKELEGMFRRVLREELSPRVTVNAARSAKKNAKVTAKKRRAAKKASR